MTEPRTNIAIHVHDTPDVIYDALARVFPEQSGEVNRWVRIVTDNGVELTFFATLKEVDTDG